MLGRWVWIRGSNPIPWRVSIHGPDPRNEDYKDDLSAELRRMFDDPEPTTMDLDINFKFIRKLASRMQKADTTNIQKLTEDALHGVLFEDDVQVRKISSEMLEQSKICDEPAIGIYAQRYMGIIRVRTPWDGGPGIWNEPEKRTTGTWKPPDTTQFT